MKAVELRNVTKVYKTKYYEVVALKNVNLEVELGEFIAVMGPSGSGKSTLLNLVGCLDKPTKGEVIIKGKRTIDLSDRELTKLRRDEIGFIFQQYNLVPTLTVEENIELPMVFKGVSKEMRERRVKELAEKLGIYDLLERKPAELSGGQQQRVAIARALANKPSILLCDEPTGNLDSKSGEMVMEAIREMNEEGVTVILVTHDETLKRYAERIVKLRDGMIVDVSPDGS